MSEMKWESKEENDHLQEMDWQMMKGIVSEEEGSKVGKRGWKGMTKVHGEAVGKRIKDETLCASRAHTKKGAQQRFQVEWLGHPMKIQ